MAQRKITWTKQAIRDFNAAIEYIRSNSEQSADTFKEKLLDKIGSLAEDKIVHRKDPFKKNNDGNYLYFEFLRYRIVYYAKTDEVFIIRVRHTSREPKKY